MLCSPVEQKMIVKWFHWVLKICPKVQVLISHFSEVNDLLDEYFNPNLSPKFAFKNSGV